MKVSLAYGRGQLEVDFPPDRTTVIVPAHAPGLPDERAAMIDALNDPVNHVPLRQLIRPDSRICIVHTDLTRPTPNERLIPWLLDYLLEAGARPGNVLLLNALGSHRPNTRAELERLLSREVVERFRCLNHSATDEECLQVGLSRAGEPALINRHFLEADVRIVTGFIEPHFFAGFSGGPKGIMPGIASLRTIQNNHSVKHIGDSRASFGMTEGNPLWEELRDIAVASGPSFLLNVTLNAERGITGVFAGDLCAAHQRGCEFVRKVAMQPQDRAYDLVVTTNSGYPLDMNLYQGVKGMRAAASIVREKGTILLVAECSEGIPYGSPHERLLHSVDDPEEILQRIETPGFVWPEQWQSQIQALIQRQAHVHLFSSLPERAVRSAHLEPCKSIEEFIEVHGKAPIRIAVLPQGPMTIPYLVSAS